MFESPLPCSSLSQKQNRHTPHHRIPPENDLMSDLLGTWRHHSTLTVISTYNSALYKYSRSDSFIFITLLPTKLSSCNQFLNHCLLILIHKIRKEYVQVSNVENQQYWYVSQLKSDVVYIFLHICIDFKVTATKTEVLLLFSDILPQLSL